MCEVKLKAPVLICGVFVPLLGSDEEEHCDGRRHSFTALSPVRISLPVHPTLITLPLKSRAEERPTGRVVFWERLGDWDGPLAV